MLSEEIYFLGFSLLVLASLLLTLLVLTAPPDYVESRLPVKGLKRIRLRAFIRTADNKANRAGVVLTRIAFRSAFLSFT